MRNKKRKLPPFTVEVVHGRPWWNRSPRVHIGIQALVVIIAVAGWWL